MDIKKIRQLAAILNKENLEEMEIKEGETVIRLKRASVATQVVQPVADQSVLVQQTAPPAVETPEPKLKKGPSAGNRIITSPIVGTLYRSPSPKAESYIKEGDEVQAGQVLCIIEAMKLMNELEAEFPCIIVKVLVENGNPVEYGEELFEVKPL